MQTASNAQPPGLRGGYTTVWSRPFSPADVERIYQERFAPGNGDKRSEPYQIGFRQCLEHRLLGITIPANQYADASAERDAFYAGVEHAHRHAHRAKEAAQ